MKKKNLLKSIKCLIHKRKKALYYCYTRQRKKLEPKKPTLKLD